MTWSRPLVIHVALFVAGVTVFGLVAWSRIWHQSPDPHFVYQADAWLNGKIAIDPPPTKGDDWAKVETVVLDDGSQVRGRRLNTRKAFRVVGGDEIPLSRVTATRGTTTFMSFPPLPAALMLPQAALGGRAGNDVLPTVVIAALILPLAFATLRRLHAAGCSSRSVGDDLWLVATLAFGTVLFFAAVQGKVWFTAHVVGVALLLGYAWASIEARYPLIAGLCLGLATLTRTPMAFMFPLFLLEAWRMFGPRLAVDGGATGGPSWVPLIRRVATFAAPVVVIGVAAAVYNYQRFGEPAEFGHSYLAVRQQAQMEAHGLFSYHYLARNLAVAFTLLPELPDRGPFVQISGHGLAMWVTTPILLTLLWPRLGGGDHADRRRWMHRALWLTVAAVAVPTFFYQNSGWLQFGYRFSLDYMPFLILLLAVGGRPLRWAARSLIVIGIVVNLFGAITFGRYMDYYRFRGNAYDVVVAH